MISNAPPPPGAPAAPGAAPQPADQFQVFFRQIMELKTEQEQYHAFAGLCAHPDQAIRIGALSQMIDIAISVLAVDAADSKVRQWLAEFNSCSIGMPIPESVSSELPGGVSVEISIHGASNIPPAIMMPDKVELGMLQMSKVQASRCERNLKRLQMELRIELRKKEWLKDLYGHDSPGQRAAAADVRSTRADRK